MVTVGRSEVYSSTLLGMRSNPALLIEKIYPILDQRVRLGLTPTNAALSRDRRYLPEMALGGGFAITLLLGFTLHLWRRASSGQYLSELSNKKLVAENEERRPHRGAPEGFRRAPPARPRFHPDRDLRVERCRRATSTTAQASGASSATTMAGCPRRWRLWQSLIHADDLPLYRKRTESQLNGIASFIDPEYRVRARAGDWRWVYVRSKSVLAGPNGRPTRIIGTVQDITTRRESEQALRESQAEARKLSLVASKTDNLVIIGSADGKIEWVNSAFCRVMEYTLDEVVGKDPGSC